MLNVLTFVCFRFASDTLAAFVNVGGWFISAVLIVFTPFESNCGLHVRFQPALNFILFVLSVCCSVYSLQFARVVNSILAASVDKKCDIVDVLKF